MGCVVVASAARGAGGGMSEFWPDADGGATAPRTPTPRPRPFWLAALPPRDAAPPLSGTSTPTSASSAAASPGCGRRCTPRPTTRRATSSCSRPTRSASARAGATAASSSRSLTHGLDNGLARFAEEMPSARAARAGELRRAAGRPRRATAIDCDFEPTGDARRAHRAPTRSAWIEEEVERAARASATTSRCSTATAMRAEVALADLPRRRSGTAPAPACSTPASSRDGLRDAALRGAACGSSSTRAARGARAARATAVDVR